MVVTIGTVAKNVGGHMTKANKKFDLDLEKGQAMEATFKKYMEGDMVEVKSERHIWELTGNHFVEYESYGKPSGIAATESHWWALMLIDEDEVPRCTYVVRVEQLKELARKYINTDRDVVGGDDNKSRGVLVPIKEIALLPFKG